MKTHQALSSTDALEELIKRLLPEQANLQVDRLVFTPGELMVVLATWGYPFSNKQRKSQITTLSLATYTSDEEEMELLELSFTHFWNSYPQEQLQEEMAVGALVPLLAASQPFPRCFPDGSRLVSTHTAQVRSCHHVLESPLLAPAAVHEENGSRVAAGEHTCCSGRQEIIPLLPGVQV